MGWRRGLAVAVAASLSAGALWLAAVLPAGAGTRPSWSVTPTPGKGALDAVSCASNVSCVAVGERLGSGSSSVVSAESWDGKTWKVLPIKAPPNGVLLGVSCVSATWCRAVGFVHPTASPGSRSRAFMESWDGHGWTSVLTKQPLGSGLWGVSCASRSWCVAVGDYQNSHGVTQTLIESWNGHQWTILASPNQGDSAVGGVSCTSSRYCVAVGYAGSSLHALIETWNGSRWRIASNHADNAELNGVSCVSPTFCMAVGWQYGDSGEALAETWDGHTWTITPTPETASSDGRWARFDGVSCVTSNLCRAVGEFDRQPDFASDATIIDTWHNQRWSLTNPQALSPTTALSSVTCLAPTFCKAVGWANYVASHG